MWENEDQKKSEFGHFLCRGSEDGLKDFPYFSWHKRPYFHITLSTFLQSDCEENHEIHIMDPSRCYFYPFSSFNEIFSCEKSQSIKWRCELSLRLPHSNKNSLYLYLAITIYRVDILKYFSINFLFTCQTILSHTVLVLCYQSFTKQNIYYIEARMLKSSLTSLIEAWNKK